MAGKCLPGLCLTVLALARPSEELGLITSIEKTEHALEKVLEKVPALGQL